MSRFNCVVLIVLVLIHIACNKADDDFAGKDILRGRLAYRDIYMGEDAAKPIANRVVKLAYSPSDTANFLYSDTTDAEGYFLFTNVSKDRTYDLSFSDTLVGIRYTAFFTVTPPNTEITLVALNDSLQQNGIFVESRLNGQPIGNTRICIFSHEADFNADTCSGSVVSKFTNTSGRQIFYGLQPNTYYIRGFKKIGNDMYQASAKSITVSSSHIQKLVLDLQKVENTNTIKIHVNDEFNTPVTAVNVWMYSSRSVFLMDTAGTRHLYADVTGGSGTATFFNINAGKYYLRSSLSIGDTVLRGMDSIVVPASGLAEKTMTIK